MKRRRNYIPFPEKLAATLACLLSQEDRDFYRAAHATCDHILSLFQFDHIQLHAFGGEDKWWNLDPKLVAAHKEKSKRDTSIVAKAKRIDRKWSDIFPDAKKTHPKPSWPKRKLQSRGFR